MNTHEAWKGTIMGEEGECAAFVINTVASPFILSGITKPEEQYTFSFLGSSDAEGSITVGGKTFPMTGEWAKYDVTFIAEGTDLSLYFNTVGTYYIFHPQLEVGNLPSDYVPAPEDTDDSIDAYNQNIESVQKSVTQLALDADSVKFSVRDLEQIVNSTTQEVKATKEQITSMELQSGQLEVKIEKLANDGTKKVSNTTGTFNENGLTIDKTDSQTKSQVTPDGLTVYKKNGVDSQSEVLTATSEGVNATNLHATTYLIVGGRSRFENYGSDRTGCFWIGG